MSFWPAVSQAFLVRHGLVFVDAYSGGWLVQVLDVLVSYLGFFPLASSVGCWLEVVEVYP